MGRAIFNGSPRGWVEQVKAGIIQLEVVKVQYKDAEKESFLYNVYQLENGHRKDIYFPCANSELRKFSFVNNAVTQSWDVMSVYEDDSNKVTKDDADTYALYECWYLVAEKICEAAGLNPEVFKAQFTTENKDGEPFAWYDAPTNSQNSKSPWSYDAWLCSPGIPTFKIRGALIIHAGVTNRNENRVNGISIKFGLGRYKWINNRAPPLQHKKRTAAELEAERGEPNAKKANRGQPSAATISKMKAMALERAVSETPDREGSD